MVNVTASQCPAQDALAGAAPDPQMDVGLCLRVRERAAALRPEHCTSRPAPPYLLTDEDVKQIAS